jgi:hypothetical protein
MARITTSATCRHCGRELLSNQIDNHEKKKCAKRPEALSMLREVLASGNDPSVALGWTTYIRLQQLDKRLPSFASIKFAFGSWREMIQALGFVSPREVNRRLLPASIDELRRLSQVLYDGEAGPNHSDYADHADRSGGAQSVDVLIDLCGSWDVVLAHAELKHENRVYYWHARQQRALGIKKPLHRSNGDSLDAPLGPDETLTGLPEIPQRPVPVIAAHRLPGGGMLYRLPKLPDDLAPRVYGHVVSQVIETSREIRYSLK